MTESSEESRTARAPEGTGDHALALEKKCTYCDSPMPAHARVCVNCNRDEKWYLNYIRIGDLLLLVSILVSFGMVYLSYRNFHESREERVMASQALEIASNAESIVIKGKEQLQQLEASNEEGKNEVAKIKSLVTDAEGKLAKLADATKEAAQKALSLSAQVNQYEKELRAKTERIQALEKQAKLIRSIDGSIQCTFSGNWKHHPGSIVPVSWNKAQIYARIFQKSETESEAILFLLENMSMSKLPDGNLKVNLEIRAKPGAGPLGQEVGVLTRYTHLVVYVPFIDQDATVDSRITLNEINGYLYVNGERRSKLSETQSFEIPIQKGKTLGVQLNKIRLFTDLAE